MKLTAAELCNKLDLARSKFPVHSVWQHYKGANYEVIGHTIHTGEALQTLVIYRRVSDLIEDVGTTFARPVSEWSETVLDEDENSYVARFRRVL